MPVELNKGNFLQEDYLPILSRLLNSYSPISNEGFKLILGKGTIEPYSKNEIVFHVNRFNEFEYFQLEGLSHRFILDIDSQVLTTGLYQNEVIITPNFARTKNGLSIFSLQALTDCVFFKIPIRAFEELRRQNSQFEKLAHSVVENEFKNSINSEILFRSFSAKERLLYFRTNFYQLENIIPHSVIASFLGITTVSLSRLRRELAK